MSSEGLKPENIVSQDVRNSVQTELQPENIVSQDVHDNVQTEPQQQDEYPSYASVVEICSEDLGEDIVVGEEIVIDGVIVPIRSHFSSTILRVFATVQIATIIFICLWFNRSKVAVHPFTLSTQTELNYRAYLREVVRNVSDTNLLDDPLSTQSLALDLFAINMQRLIDSSIIDVNDTEKIIERYAGIVISASFSAHGLNHYGHVRPSSAPPFAELCTLPHMVCSEDGTVIGVVIQNQKTTHFGGGTIPKEISVLRSLTHVVIYRSAIHGSIPKELAKLEHLKTIDIRENLITGEIPTEIGNLQSLEVLFLSKNSISNPIPSELGKATSLVQLDLSHNELVGTVPSQLTSLHHLNAISLEDNNKLTGDIDFLCRDEIKNVSTSEEEDFEGTYDLMNIGVHVDCAFNVPSLNCRCCDCT